METYYTGLRNNTTSRNAFGTAFAAAIQTFLTQHYYAGIPCGTSVLPVELLNFKGIADKEGNHLTWLFADNKDVQSVEILKSANGHDFIPLSILSKNEVEFVDKTPLSLTYYRLKINELNGKSTISKTITVQAQNQSNLKIFPTLTTGMLTIETGVTGYFHILNLLGQQVLTGQIGQLIDVSMLPQGTYILKIGEGQTKFVKYAN